MNKYTNMNKYTVNRFVLKDNFSIRGYRNIQSFVMELTFVKMRVK